MFAAAPSTPEPSSTADTGPALSRVAAPMSSAVMGATAPSTSSARTSTPFAILVSPFVERRPVRRLDQLRFFEAAGERHRLLFGRVALHDLDLRVHYRHEELFERQPLPERARVEANVRRGPRLDLLARRGHDLLQLRVARLAELVADGDDGGQRRFDGLEGIREHALYRHL